MNIFPFPKPKFNYIFSCQIHLFHFYWVKIIDFLINNRRIIYSSSILYYSLSLKKNNFVKHFFFFLPIFFFIHHWQPIQLDFFHDSFILSSIQGKGQIQPDMVISLLREGSNPRWFGSGEKFWRNYWGSFDWFWNGFGMAYGVPNALHTRR